MNSCNGRRGSREFLTVSYFLRRGISGLGALNVTGVPVSDTSRDQSGDSFRNWRNWPPKAAFSTEVTCALTISVADGGRL